MSGGGGGSSKVKDTPEQRYNAQVAAERWNYAQEKLVPLENQYMDDVKAMDSAQNRAYVAGRANQAGQAQLSSALSQTPATLGASGVDPSSGRGFGARAGITRQVGSAAGDAAGRGVNQTAQGYAQGLSNLIAIGQGQEGTATAGLSTVANQSVNQAIQNNQRAYNKRQSNLQLLGALGGAGAGFAMGGSSPARTGGQYGGGAIGNLYG